MRFFTFSARLTLLLILGFSQTEAQTILFSEDFNGCGLPAGWTVSSQGNQNPVWYVGNSVLNDDNNGESMNGSCFLFIDDDATGDQTPPYIIDFISPAFDASQFPTSILTVDVHYRDWGDGDEYFDVLLTDGTTEYLLSHFDENRRNTDTLADFFTVRYDLSFLTHSDNVRLIFRYDDAGGFNWWAGVDNILVQGSGTGENVIAEPFNSCEKPTGWETEVLTGVDDWQFGVIDTGKALAGASSMDGSCFVYFDDDIIGTDAPFSTVRLKSPWFDGSDYSQFTLAFDAILRYYTEKLAVLVEHGDGSQYVVSESSGDIGGPYFQDYQSLVLDLTPYRSAQMRVVFEYDDGDTWAWWAGLDNVKVTGSGAANDICTNAVNIQTGTNCEPASTANALFDGPEAPCVERSAGGLWYRWVADFSGTARISTHADFNDVVNVFTGQCSSPVLVQCYNRDEHGFTGEDMYFAVQSGTSYLIRVSGQSGGFGKPKGNICLAVTQVNAPPAGPANDLCAQAQTLTVNSGAPVSGNNIQAEMGIQPALNNLARSDIWYQFTAPALTANQVLEIRSNASFSDIITVYSGACASLSEVAGNHLGQRLELNTLAAGQVYKIQIAGTFATVEGAVAPEIITKTINAPANDACTTAQLVIPGQGCVDGTVTGATTSGYTPPCVPQVGGDVWFQFVAPVSGAVRLNTGADFQHVLAVWKGDCNGLESVSCYINPVRCDGDITLGALVPGFTYYIQVAARSAEHPAFGDFCLRLTDGILPPDVLPLVLTVNEQCVSNDMARLKILLTGGLMPYTFQGNPNNEVLAAGEPWLVVVNDAGGCERSLSGVVKPCQAPDCSLTGMLSTVQPLCNGSFNGAITPQATGGLAPYTYQWSNGATTAGLVALSGGVYTVTITDALGCELEISTTLIDPTPIIVIPGNVQQPTIGNNNGAIFVDISGGSGAYSYAWSKAGVPFATSEDLTGAAAGDYQLVVTDANGCTATYDFMLSDLVSTGEVAEVLYTEVFPNPAYEKAVLSVSFPSPRTLHLSLMDASGRVLRAWTQRQVMEQNIPLDLRQLPSGTYQLTIRTGQEVLIEKVVVR